jgi:hypothetical protein
MSDTPIKNTSLHFTIGKQKSKALNARRQVVAVADCFD